MGPTCLMCFLSSPMSARWYSMPGKTSDSSENSSGMSSATSFGTIVSHTDWIRICGGRAAPIG